MTASNVGTLLAIGVTLSIVGQANAQSQNCPAVVMPGECNDDTGCCGGTNWSGNSGMIGDPVIASSGQVYEIYRDVHLPGTIPFNLMRRYVSRANKYWGSIANQSQVNYWLGGQYNDLASDSAYNRFIPRPFGSDPVSPKYSATWWNSLMQGVKIERFSAAPNFFNIVLLDPNGVDIHFNQPSGNMPSPGMMNVAAEDLGYRGKLWFSGLAADSGISTDGGTRFILYDKTRGRVEYAAVYRSVSAGAYSGETFWFLPTRFEDLQYRDAGTTVRYAVPAGCSVPDSGFAPNGAPWVSDITTSDGAHLRFTWSWLPTLGGGFVDHECVVRDVQIEDKSTSTYSTLVHYDYELPSDGGSEMAGRLRAVTKPREGTSESYAYPNVLVGLASSAFVVDAGGFVTANYLDSRYAVVAQSHSIPLNDMTLTYPLCAEINPCPFSSGYTNVSYSVGYGGANGGAATLTSSYGLSQGARGSDHGYIPTSNLHGGSAANAANVSSGVTSSTFYSSASPPTEAMPLAETATTDKRGAVTAYTQAVTSNGAFTNFPELLSVNIGSLDRTDMTYQYGGSGQNPRLYEQLKFSEQKDSVLGPPGAKATTKEWRDPSTNRLTKVTRTGYTQGLSGVSTTQVVATFYRTTQSCGGSATDPLGRTLEVHGPCILGDSSHEGDADCPVPYPVTVNSYYPDSPTQQNNRNRLYRVYRYSNGSADCGGSPLIAEYSNYDDLGYARTIADENGDVLQLTFDSAGHMTSRTKNAATTRFSYDQGELTAVMYPEGNCEIFCHRTDVGTSACSGPWTPMIRWRAKKTCTATGPTTFTLGDRWSERVNYTYGVDGNRTREEYRACPNNDCSPGTAGEVRRVLKFAYDAHGRNTWKGVGDSSGQYGSSSSFDRSDNLTGVGAPYNNVPDFCGNTTSTSDQPTSQLCNSLVYDRANRLAIVDQSPGDAGLPQRTCFDYDAQGNISRTSVGCPNTSNCAINDGGLSGCSPGPSDYKWDDFGNLVETQLPDTYDVSAPGQKGWTRRTYDARGNVVFEQNQTMRSSTQYLEHTYDKLGRPTSIVTRPTNVVSWSATYDLTGSPPAGWPQPSKTMGRLRSRTDSWWSTYYGYDAVGRVTKEIRIPAWDAGVPQTLPNNPTTTYAYSDNGNLTTLTYPHQRQVVYTYGSTDGKNDRVASVSVTVFGAGGSSTLQSLVTNVKWEPYGGLRGYTAKTLTTAAMIDVEYMVGDNSTQVPSSNCPTSAPSMASYDLTGRVRSLRVSTSGTTSGDILKRTYTWKADQVSRIDTCYLGDTTSIAEDIGSNVQPGYDAAQQLRSVVLPNFSATGGWQGANTYSYDKRGNRTVNDLGGYNAIGYSYLSTNSASLDLLGSENSGGLAQNYTYDYDGRQRTKVVPADSSGYNGTQWSYDYSSPSASPTFKAVVVSSGFSSYSYNYYYDAVNRRIAKVYPTSAADFFFYDLGHQMLADQGVSSIVSGSPSHPVDDYVWLGGRPIAVVRGSFNSSWVRQPDLTGTCSRNDEATACDATLVITDHVGKPVMAIDSSRRISGVGESDPFGSLNRVEMWWGTGWTYGAGAGDTSIDISQPNHGLSMAFRSRFTRLDTEPINTQHGGFCFQGALKDYVRQSAGPLFSACGDVGGYHAGSTYSPWCNVGSVGGSSTYRLTWHTAAGNCGPGDCSCSNSNWPFGGFTVRNYEYRRFQAGAVPFFPALRFPGQYFDEETHLHENWNRYYDPEVGRYLQPDPILQSPRAVRALAGRGMVTPVYSYAMNNPLHYNDPTGRVVGFDDAIELTAAAAAVGIGELLVYAGVFTAGVAGGWCIGTHCLGDLDDLLGTKAHSPVLESRSRGSRPEGCPTGTKPIDAQGWDKDKIHGVKDAVGAGPTDWVGVDADGNIWTHGEEGGAENWGPPVDLIPGSGK